MAKIHFRTLTEKTLKPETAAISARKRSLSFHGGMDKLVDEHRRLSRAYVLSACLNLLLFAVLFWRVIAH